MPNEPHRLEAYSILLLSGALAIAIPCVLAFGARLVQGRAGQVAGAGVFEDRAPKKINTRVFLALNISSGVVSMALLVLPCAVVLKAIVSGGDLDLGIRAMAAVAGGAVILGTGMMYASRKGDLHPIRSFRDEGSANGDLGRRP